MSSEAIAQAEPASRDDSSSVSAPGQPPILSALASGLGLWCAFPPANWSWLAWVALVPLFLLIQSTRSRVSIYLGSWAGGFLFWLLSIYWVSLTDPDAAFAWVVMAMALSVWWPGFIGLSRLAVIRFGIPRIIAAPVIWVGLEFIRAHILTGFAWYYLGHTQHQVLPLIQIADFTGALGVSLLIAVVNAYLADLWSSPIWESHASGQRISRPQLIRGGVVLGLLILTVGYGFFRVSTGRFKDGPRLALMQSNIEQNRKMGTSAESLFVTYRSLIERCLRTSPPPDMIVWPETAFPYQYVIRDPELTPAEFERQAKKLSPKDPNAVQSWVERQKTSESIIHPMVDQVRIPMLVGVLVYDFHMRGLSKFNSALLIEPSVKKLQRYAKMHLVPFGEYVPLVDMFPWLKILTPYEAANVPNLTFGTEATSFTLGQYRYATAICFEDTVPQAVRRFFTNAPDGRSPDVLLNISNDGWFRGSSEHDMHLAISVFRAIENRVPLARAVNVGITALIDGNGRVLSSVSKLTEDVLTVTVPLDDRESFYTAWGDWLGSACLAATAGLLIVRIALGFRRLWRPVATPAQAI